MKISDGNIFLDLDYEIRAERVKITGSAVEPQLGYDRDAQHYNLLGGTVLPREITIEGYITGDVEENRHYLYKMCAPLKTLWLYDGDYRMEITVLRAPELSDERRYKDKLFRFTIRALCLSPYWSAISAKKYIFYSCGGESTDQSALKVLNEGHVPSGFNISILMNTSANFLTLRKGSEYIKINKPLDILDTVIIDTSSGKKSVMLKKDGQDALVSLIEYVSPDSTFFSLDKGQNQIDFVVSEGVAHMTLEYIPRYIR